MVTLAESDKSQIRRWFGYSRIYVQLYPRLENAFTAVQAIADGGSQPTDDAVRLIQGWLANLADLEQAELNLAGQMAIVNAGTDKVALDAAGKGLYGLRKIMKRYIGHISDTLSTKPFRDIFDPVDASYPPDELERRFSDYGM